MPRVLELYEKMSDNSYEATRAARAQQAQALMSIISRHKKAASLLDVGAGSEILVEEALASRFAAKGIEPSSPLQAIAAQRGLPVTHGVLPNSELPGPFDVVTLIDVIERSARSRRLVAPDQERHGAGRDLRRGHADVELGCGALDMGWKWWHFRAAHIGYFNKSTLGLALEKAGLRASAITRPSWRLPRVPGEEGVQLSSPAVSPASPPIRIGLWFQLICINSLLFICKHDA